MCLLDTSITPSNHTNAKTQHLHLQMNPRSWKCVSVANPCKTCLHNARVCPHIGKTHLRVSIFQCQDKMVVSNTGLPSIYLNSQKPRFCDILLTKYCWDVLLCGCKGVLSRGFCLFPKCIYVRVSKKPRYVIQVNIQNQKRMEIEIIQIRAFK